MPAGVWRVDPLRGGIFTMPLYGKTTESLKLERGSPLSSKPVLRRGNVKTDSLVRL